MASNSTIASPASTQLWLLHGPAIEAQEMATNPEGIKFFSNPWRTVIYPVVADVKAPSSWKTILWHTYASFASFQSDIQNDRVPAGTKIVAYDVESWSFTPANEQSDPIGYTIKFAKLAHAHGYKMLSTPAEDVLKLKPGENKFAAFIKFGMAKAVAPYVDYYSIQSQDLEQGPASYVAYTQTIVDQLHGANPKVIVTGGISTQGPENAQHPTTGAEIDTAIHASSKLVSGYWLNIVGATTPIASDALTNL